MIHSYRKYIVFWDEDTPIYKADMTPLEDINKIKELMWDMYNHSNEGECSEIIAEELTMKFLT